MINSQKLLPASRSSAIVKVDKSKSLNFLTKKTSVKSGALVKSESKESRDVNNKLVRIDSFFKSELIASQKKSEQTRKKDEKQDFEEAEKKLETPKMMGLGLPKFPQLPNIGFLERIKRFIFFTAVGWALPTILELLPKLEGILKIIGGVYNFAEGLFGKLFDGFMSLVKFGGDLKDKTIGFIASAKASVGGDYQTEFNKLEKQFNDFANLSIVAGLLSLDIGLAAVDEFKKWRGKQRPKTPEGPKPPRPKPKTPEGPKPLGPKPKPSLWEKLTGGLKSKFSKFAGKLAGPFKKFAGAAIPGIGAAVGFMDAQSRSKSGDKLGAFLAGLSASLDAFTAAVAIAGLASAATGIGIPAAAALGAVAAAAGTISMGIDVVLLIRDIIKTVFPSIPMFSRGGRIVRRYQGGGTTTRAGKPVGTPARRTIAPVRRKPKVKIQPPKSQPGKDVGGETKIQKLYPNTDPKIVTAKDWMSGDFAGTFQQYLESIKDRKDKIPNPFKAITSTAKVLKEIPLVGGIMGAAVDIALGQKPDARVYRSLASGISYLVESIANQRTNESVISLLRDIRGFADGGNITASRELRNNYSSLNSEDLLSKVLGPTIEQRVNEAIKGIQKELQKKDVKPNGRGPGDRNDAGPDGNIGVYPGSISVSGGNADFWTLVAITALETENSQGRADVAQSIYNRVASRLNFGQRNNTIKDHIIAPGQYSPVGESNRSLWEGIVDKQSAIAAIESHSRGRGRGRLLVDAAVAAITDSSLQKNAAEFVGGRTDFNSTSVYPQDPRDGVGITSRLGHRFGWFVGPESKSFGRRNPGPASAPSLGATVTRTDSSNKPSDTLIQSYGLYVENPSGRKARGYSGLESHHDYSQSRIYNGNEVRDFTLIGKGEKYKNLGIPSPVTGTIEYAGNANDGFGNKVVIRTNDGQKILMGHFDSLRVRTGDKVTEFSTILGGQGDTGNSRGYHIHMDAPSSIIRRYVDTLASRENQRPPQKPQEQPGQPQRPTPTPPSLANVQRRIGSMPSREGEVLRIPGIGEIRIEKNQYGTLIKRYYLTGQRTPVEQNKFFDRVRSQTSSSSPQPSRPNTSRQQQSQSQQIMNTAEMTIDQIRKAIMTIKPGQKIIFTGVGSVQGGRDWMGFPQTKYFTPGGDELNEKQFAERYKRSIRSSGRQGGGLISPSKSNRPIPNSFASYESPGNGMMLAIQPIIIERPVPVGRSRGSIIDFIPTSVNNTNTTPLSIG